MDQTFLCDLCHQKILFTDRCRDETIFESGWAICAHCESDFRQHLAMSLSRSLSRVGRGANRCSAQPGLAPPSLVRSVDAKLQDVAVPLQTPEKQRLHQNEGAWTFPHIVGSGYQPAKRK